MGGKYVKFSRGEETIKIEIRDATHRILHRMTYRLNNRKDIYNMLSALEKYIPYTIRQVIGNDDWI